MLTVCVNPCNAGYPSFFPCDWLAQLGCSYIQVLQGIMLMFHPKPHTVQVHGFRPSHHILLVTIHINPITHGVLLHRPMFAMVQIGASRSSTDHPGAHETRGPGYLLHDTIGGFLSPLGGELLLLYYHPLQNQSQNTLHWALAVFITLFLVQHHTEASCSWHDINRTVQINGITISHILAIQHLSNRYSNVR